MQGMEKPQVDPNANYGMQVFAQARDSGPPPIQVGYGPGITGYSCLPPDNQVICNPPKSGPVPVQVGYGAGISGNSFGDASRYSLEMGQEASQSSGQQQPSQRPQA